MNKIYYHWENLEEGTQITSPQTRTGRRLLDALWSTQYETYKEINFILQDWSHNAKFGLMWPDFF